jgi:hypothetical protein
MRTFALALWVSITAWPAFAGCGAFLIGGCPVPPGYHVGAPAPLIGMGLQGILVVGSVLLGSKLLGRRKK